MTFEVPSERRRFYLERGLRKRPISQSRSLGRLMLLPRAEIEMHPQELFGDISAVVIGGVATRAYAPERQTKDIDFLVDHERYEEATARLQSLGWKRVEHLAFPNTSLGLYGTAWTKGEVEVDVISTEQRWAPEALDIDAFDQTGLRVIALPYLVLMKIDSARGIDQGDLTRMLGRLDEPSLDEVVKVVERHSGDPQAAEDVRQYALLGRLEWGCS